MAEGLFGMTGEGFQRPVIALQLKVDARLCLVVFSKCAADTALDHKV